MCKYLKMFENYSIYEIVQSTLILPNISLCIQENDIYYNPYVPQETRLVAKYNVTSTSEPTALRSNFEENIFKSMEIDGVVLDELMTEYTFDTTGVHTVKYELYDETKLGNNAPVFYNGNLIECVIPASVTTIGNNAFNSCTSLTNVVIPDSVININSSVFASCTSLTSIIIPDSVTSIGNNVFSGSNISSINIPNNLSSIGNYAFVSNNNNMNVYLDNSIVTSLGNYVNTTSIKSIEFGPHAVNQNGSLYFSSFNGLFNLENITLPEGLTLFPMLTGCTSLKTVNIPTTVTTFSNYNCFAGCMQLQNSYVENGIKYIDVNGFGTFVIGVSDYTLQSYTIKNGVKSLPFGFSSSFTNIQSITLPESLISVLDDSFSYLCEKNILTSQQIDFIENINPNAISEIVKLMQKPRSYFEDKYFSICTLGSGYIYYKFVDTSSASSDSNYKVIEYSTNNGSTWSSINNLNNQQKSIYVSSNKIVLFRSTIEPGSTGIGNIHTNFDFYLCGNVMSLLYGDNFVNQTSLSGKNYAFYQLLSQRSWSSYRGRLKNINKLILPATTLSNYCYTEMFCYCTALTDISNIELPATTATERCYYEMFEGCTSLTTAPSILPAITLANYCYSLMFGGCTSLTTAPALSATTLSSFCCRSMFNGCTSLTTAPVLSATALATYCYELMFSGCTSLTTAPTLPATTIVNGCYHQMFQNCTSLTSIPNLPATTLATACYKEMFKGCTALTTVLSLSATTLGKECYYSMFNGCTALTTAPTLPATTLAESCYNNMFNGCTSLTDISNIELPAITLVKDCYASMFIGCTELTKLMDELPATTGAQTCYSYMFNGCKKITESPIIKIQSFGGNDCYYMFNGCSLLSKITLLSTSINNNGLNSWVSNVAASGTFIKDASMTTLPTGTSGIPSGWTVQDYSAQQTNQANLFDILYSDASGNLSFTSEILPVSEGKTPIGLCIAGTGFFGVNEPARWISLLWMSDEAPFTGTFEMNLRWAGVEKFNENDQNINTDISTITNIQTTHLNGSSSGYLADNNSNHSTPEIPSLYTANNEWNLSALGTTNTYAITDIDGKSKTNKILATIVYQPNWQTDNSIQNEERVGYAPAATACARYYTLGTQPGDWYLGSCGEIAPLLANQNAISLKLGLISEVYPNYCSNNIAGGNIFWTSTEYNDTQAYVLNLDGKKIEPRNKESNYGLIGILAY